MYLHRYETIDVEGKKVYSVGIKIRKTDKIYNILWGKCIKQIDILEKEYIDIVKKHGGRVKVRYMQLLNPEFKTKENRERFIEYIDSKIMIKKLAEEK